MKSSAEGYIQFQGYGINAAGSTVIPFGGNGHFRPHQDNSNLPWCYNLCLDKAECFWFSHDPATGGNGRCQLYTNVQIAPGGPPVTQNLYVLKGLRANLLYTPIRCTAQNEYNVNGQQLTICSARVDFDNIPPYSVRGTKDISFVLPRNSHSHHRYSSRVKSTKCYGSPFTLWISNKVLVRKYNGVIRNLMPEDQLLDYMEDGTPYEMQSEVPDGEVLYETVGDYIYYFETNRGQVVKVQSGELTDQTLLTKHFQDREQYCPNGFQSAFNNIAQNINPPRSGVWNEVEYNAGHIISCGLLGPNGMTNFMVQTKHSNAGCYNGAELVLRSLLRGGCRVRYAVNIDYPRTASDFQKIKAGVPGNIMNAIYPMNGNQTESEDTQYCRQFYTPYRATISIRITGAANPKCANVHNAMVPLTRWTRTFGYRDGSISRVLAHWLVENSNNEIQMEQLQSMLMHEKKQCFNSNNQQIPPLQVSDNFQNAYIGGAGNNVHLIINGNRVVQVQQGYNGEPQFSYDSTSKQIYTIIEGSRFCLRHTFTRMVPCKPGDPHDNYAFFNFVQTPYTIPQMGLGQANEARICNADDRCLRIDGGEINQIEAANGNLFEARLTT